MRNTSELIDRIISLLDENFFVYVQRETCKIIAIPEFEDPMDFMDFSDDNYELLYSEVESNPDDYCQIQKLNSRELYNTMMDFALEQERADSIQLVKALRTKNPIVEFKKTTSIMGSTIYNGWVTFYKDQFCRIIRNRLYKEHIRLQTEKYN